MATRTLELAIVDVPPIVRVVEMPVVMERNRKDDATYEEGTVTNGYGRCYGAEVTVQIGTEANIEIDYTVNAISEETFTTWKSQASQFFSSDHWTSLNEHYSGSGRAGGFLGGCFGFFSASGRYDHYKNTSDSFRSSGSQQSEGFLKSIHNLDNTNLKMRGTLKAIGQSYVPVRVTAFINVLIIQFANGKILRAVDSADPIAAKPNGDTTGVASAPTKLNVVTV